MHTDYIRGIPTEYPSEMSREEAEQYVLMGREQWEQDGKQLSSLGKIIIVLDGDEVIIHPLARIVRTRRITGYLANTDQFNTSKKAEMQDRINHF